jgi:hypothetical protein
MAAERPPGSSQAKTLRSNALLVFIGPGLVPGVAHRGSVGFVQWPRSLYVKMTVENSGS